MESEGDVSKLRIKNTQPEDAGSYKCALKNAAGQVFCTVSLRVKETITPPDIVASCETQLNVEENTCVNFIANVKGHPEPKITWFKDDIRLQSDPRMQMSYDDEKYVLDIDHVKAVDSGIYRCRAANSAGSCSVDFELIVNGELHNCDKIYETI